MKRIYFDLILILIGVVLAVTIAENQSNPAMEQVNMEEALIVAQKESAEGVRCYQKCSGWGIGIDIGIGEMLGWSNMETEIICKPIEGVEYE